MVEQLENFQGKGSKSRKKGSNCLNGWKTSEGGNGPNVGRNIWGRLILMVKKWPKYWLEKTKETGWKNRLK